jgi:hypothetical protein
MTAKYETLDEYLDDIDATGARFGAVEESIARRPARCRASWQTQQGVRSMKVKLTMDRSASSSNKSAAVAKINRELGSKATVSGDVIAVDDGSDERKVIDILNRERVNYSRST